MICFNCGIKLHSNDHKECQLCGVKFSIICPSCEHPNPAMAKFCFNCGTKVSKTDSQSSVQNFDTLTEGRRNVAVIFADVSGFTALSEKLDPEEVREIINDCFNYITKPVYEMEGTIDKYIGDCVMILFGAKSVHSDDARRAVQCAIKMMSLIKEFSEERLSSQGFNLTLSIGVNFGLVVTGSVGNYFDKDYTVMGDIVNTAQRLQSNAGKGVILVSESVYNETKDMIRYSKPTEVLVKNKENPVRCYSPVGVNVAYNLEGDTPFIEREYEMNVLNSIYNEALNTGMKCIALVGEAGIGKTRLLKEFVPKVGKDIKSVWVDCTPASQNKVYYVISSILMKVMNINSEDSTSVKHRRLISFLDFILGDLNSEDIKRNGDFIGLVLGLARDNEFQNILNAMSFDNIKREISKQLGIFFKYLSKKNKLLLIVEDIHWSDANSVKILSELIVALSGFSATFIFTSRHDLEDLEHNEKLKYQRLRLKPLSREGIGCLACRLLKCSLVDNALLDVVSKFTNGNPLFIKEYISNIKRNEKYRVENGMVFLSSNELSLLPNNIQSLILSNFSELEDPSKYFLQAASVVGKDFTLSQVNELLEFNIDEVDVLSLPIKLNIISLKSVYTSSGIVEKIFTFNQDMEREVIYENILKKKKKELHKQIAEIIENRFVREIEEYYELLFVHFEKAGVYKKAAEYCYKTALRYKDYFNFHNALEYFDKFIDMTGKDNDEEIQSKKINVFKDTGYINFILANYEEALENFNNAIELANLSDDVYSIKIMMAEIFKEQDMYEDALSILNEIQPRVKQDSNIYGKLLQMRCNVLRLMSNPEALSIAKKSEKVLLKVKDYESLSETMNQAGILYYTKGDIGNALFYLNKSYKYAERINNLAVMAKLSGNIGIIYHSTGMVSKALESFNRSIDISRKISDQQGYVAGCINLGILYLDRGLFNKAEVLFEESLTLSQEILSRLNECVCLTNLGDIMYERGIYDKSMDFYNRSMDIAKEINVPMGEGINYLGYVRVSLKQGSYVKLEEHLEAAYKIFDEAGEVEYLSDYYRYKSFYSLMRGDSHLALEFCDKAINCSEEFKSDRKKVKAFRLKASILSEVGRYDRAFQLYDESIALAQQLESDYEAAKGYYGKYAAYKKLKNLEEAKVCLNEARKSIIKVDACKWAYIIEQQNV